MCVRLHLAVGASSDACLRACEWICVLVYVHEFAEDAPIGLRDPFEDVNQLRLRTQLRQYAKVL